MRQKRRFSLRVEEGVLKKIEHIAKQEGRTSNGKIEQLIKKHITQFEKEHGQGEDKGEFEIK